MNIGNLFFLETKTLKLSTFFASVQESSNLWTMFPNFIEIYKDVIAADKLNTH